MAARRVSASGLSRHRMLDGAVPSATTARASYSSASSIKHTLRVTIADFGAPARERVCLRSQILWRRRLGFTCHAGAPKLKPPSGPAISILTMNRGHAHRPLPSLGMEASGNACAVLVVHNELDSAELALTASRAAGARWPALKIP